MPASTKQVPHAVLDAIAQPAAPAGRVKREKVRDLRIHPERRNGPVRVAQPAAHNWVCDSCGVIGYGGIGILDHFDATGHTRFEPREVTS